MNSDSFPARARRCAALLAVGMALVALASISGASGTVSILVNGEPVAGGSVTNHGSAVVRLETSFVEGTILYTLDGSEPWVDSEIYFEPFVVTNTVVVRALAFSADFSETAEAGPVELVIIPFYRLNATTAGGGDITLAPPGGSYLSNTLVSVTATPLPGWVFLQWAGDTNDTNAAINIGMDRNKSVVAIFATTLTITNAGPGTVRRSPVQALHPFGAVVRLTAVPEPGNYFALWGRAASGRSNPLDFTVTNPTPAISSLFLPLGSNQVTLNLLEDGPGRIHRSPDTNAYAVGQVVTLTATPLAGFDFIYWSGDANNTLTPLTVTMTDTKSITGHFAARSDSPPIITKQPQSLLVRTGAILRLSVGADGAAPLSFQWRFNGSDLFDATNRILVLSNMGPLNAGTFDVQVSNSFGLAGTIPATVLVDTNPLCFFPPARVLIYDGPTASPPDTRGSADYAAHVAADREGNVFIAGESWNADTDKVGALVKYDRNGNAVWTNRYSGSDQGAGLNGMVADDAGNAYVTGSSRYRRDLPTGGYTHDQEYATIKYAPDGRLLWLARYKQPGVAESRISAFDIALDQVGHVDVTGNGGTIQYDRDGNQLWLSSRQGDVIKATPSGDSVYVVSHTYSESQGFRSSLSKLDSNGIVVWSGQPIPYCGRHELLELDNSGRVILAGLINGGPGDANQGDIQVLKLDGEAHTIWSLVYDGPANGSDKPEALMLDVEGNVVVTGTSCTLVPCDDSGVDTITLKLDPAGNLLWAVTYNGPANQADYAQGIKTDEAGNVYVCGSSVTGQADLQPVEAYLVKFDPDGNQLWVGRYAGPARLQDHGRDLLVDPFGRVWVAGSTKPPPARWEGTDFLTLKFDQRSVRFGAATNLLDKRFLTSIASPAGKPVRIEASTDFQNWTPLLTLTNFNGLYPVTDSSTNSDRRFYRAVLTGP